MKECANYDSIIESLKATIHNLLEDLVPQEEENRLFAGLISLLKRKKIISTDGAIATWRLSCLNYLEAIVPNLKDEELYQIGNEEFSNRFIFAPCGKITSLYWELQHQGCNGYFKNIPILDVYSEYEEVYGKSPYEKAENGEIRSFLHHVDRFALYSLD